MLTEYQKAMPFFLDWEGIITMAETKVVFYPNEKAMQRGMDKMQKQGWEVVSTEAVDQGYGCLKTGCLGLLFLPLALLGKKPKQYKVQYRRTG